MSKIFLSTFTPTLMRPEIIEALFVQREELADRIINLICSSAVGGSKHHTLLTGPRGIGKSHFISLVYHRVLKMTELKPKLGVAWLREEEWGVTSFLDLAMRVLRALIDEYDDKDLKRKVDDIYALNANAAEAERWVTLLLKEYVDGRTLLLLVENLDDLFHGLGDLGQKRLRAFIQENPFWTILATSQSLFPAVTRRVSPFYGFFRLEHLEELTLEAAAMLLSKIAVVQGDRELATFIETAEGRARVRAVHHLAGGNHRIYVIFAQFLTLTSLDELVGPLMKTIDDLTPYYQARMAQLSPQQRKLVELLSDTRGTLTVKEIAARCFMSQQTASSQLKSLREEGYVRASPVGRETYYELREPLMRLCIDVKRQRTRPIKLLVEFLRLWYSRDELRRRLDALDAHAVVEREYVAHALQEVWDGRGDPRLRSLLEELRRNMERNDYVAALRVTEELLAVQQSARNWAHHAHALTHLERYADALDAADKSLAVKPTQEALYYQWRSLSNLKRYTEALASVDQALGIEPNDTSTLARRARTLIRLEQWSEAVATLDRSLAVDDSNADTWHGRGVALAEVGRLVDAVTSLRRAVAIDPKASSAWHDLGVVFKSERQYDDALTALCRAEELGDDCGVLPFSKAEVLLVSGRWDEGLRSLEQALEKHVGEAKRRLGNVRFIIEEAVLPVRQEWRGRVHGLVAVYRRQGALARLGQGLVASIAALKPARLQGDALGEWCVVWKSALGTDPELELPIRLFNTATRYLATADKRAILELAAEERRIVEGILALEPKAGRGLRRGGVSGRRRRGASTWSRGAGGARPGR